MLGRKQSIKLVDTNLCETFAGGGGTFSIINNHQNANNNNNNNINATNNSSNNTNNHHQQNNNNNNIINSNNNNANNVTTTNESTGGGNATIVSTNPVVATPAMAGPPAAPVAIELSHSNTGVAWFNKTSVRHFMRICSVMSLMSVCANTSKTFSWYPNLMLITFIVDIVTGIVFTIEMVFKIYSRGLLNGPNPYAKDRWCQFDATMVLFLWISILLQVR